MSNKNLYDYQTPLTGYSAQSIWNQVYNISRGQIDHQMPQSIGMGQLKGTQLNHGIKMIEYDLSFEKPFELRGWSHQPHIDLLFCLGESLEFDLIKSQQHFQMQHNQTYIGRSIESEKLSHYPAGSSLKMVEIKVPLKTFEYLFQSFESSGRRLPIDLNKGWAYQPPLSYEVKRVLNELINPPDNLPLMALYKEAKLQELLALYLSDVFYKAPHQSLGDLSEFSKWDIKCIETAKQLLMNNLDKNPSLDWLSKAIGLNEYKLKKGFKRMYGQTVHTFLVESKMKKAQELLEKTDLSITEIANGLGYFNLSHFSYSFKRIYQVTPRDYRKQYFSLI